MTSTPRLVFIGAALLGLWPSLANAQVPQRPTRPLMWEVRSASGLSYLFATIHVGRSEFYPLPDPVERALIGSDALVVEARRGGGERTAEAGMFEANDTLKNHVPAALLEDINQLLPRYDLSAEQAYRLRPWRLGITLTLHELNRHDFSPRLAVDAYMADLALRSGKPIIALETQSGQQAVLEALSEEEQLALLQGSVNQIKNDRVAPLMQEIVAAWGSGNVKRCERATRASSADQPLAREINAKLIDTRNLDFARQLDTLLQGKKRYFIAVGAAHFFGKNGLIALLRERGYRIRQR
jgi:uncharacterized protein